MIHLFHGFLGSPQDFSFLKGETVRIHDLYEMNDLPQIGPEDILIGYSLGGRIALEIATKNNFKLKQLILLNAHPGLTSDKERERRKTWEDSILQDLKKKSLNEFLSDWNKQPVFLFDQPLTHLDEERFKISPLLFNKNRLSHQENYLPKILQHKEKVLYVIGCLDEKYMDLSRDILEPNGIRVAYLEAGHRLFQHPDALLKLFKSENVL